MADSVRCLSCGREYSQTQQLEQVHSIGLALMGRCSCGSWVAINQIWRKVREISLQSSQASALQPSTHAHSAHRYKQLTLF